MHIMYCADKGRAGQGRAGQGKAGQGRAGQGRAGQGRAGQGRAGQSRTRQKQRHEHDHTCIDASISMALLPILSTTTTPTKVAPTCNTAALRPLHHEYALATLSLCANSSSSSVQLCQALVPAGMNRMSHISVDA